MKRTAISALALMAFIGGAQACPFRPNDTDYAREAFASDSLAGMLFASRQHVDDRYRQACGVWQQLIACGTSEQWRRRWFRITAK